MLSNLCILEVSDEDLLGGLGACVACFAMFNDKLYTIQGAFSSSGTLAFLSAAAVQRLD